MTVIFFTIVSRNYLAYATTLMQSLAQHHPDTMRYVALADRAQGDTALDNPLFDLIAIEQLGLPEFDAFVFRYDILELNTAIKPYVFRWLRQRHPDQGLIYFDPDMLLIAPLHAIERAFAQHALAVLTPHLNAPMTDDRHPGEMAILRSGTYNLGFIAINAHAQADRLIDWWADKLEFGCVADPGAGLFTDQKWMDLVPGLFADVHILRDDGYNLAYWNLAQRHVRHDGERWLANEQPLVLLHFSGIDSDRPEMFSRHQDRYRASTIGALRPLYQHYLDQLSANGHAQHRLATYAFGHFADGEFIPRPLRMVYRRYFDKGSVNPELHPLNMPRERFDEPCDELPHRADAPVTRLMYASWRLRADLHAAFDLGEREGREGFIRWYLRAATRELGIAPRHIEPVRQAFSQGPAIPLQLDVDGDRARASGRWHWLSAACLRAIDWSCRQQWALRIYSQIAPAWRHRLRRWLERSAFVAAPTSPAPDTPRVLAADGINLIGYARGEFGVAEILRNYAAVLQHGHLPFVVRNIELGVASRQQDRRLEPYLSESLPYAVNLFCINADQLTLVRQHLATAVSARQYNIGCWFWELEKFPPQWHGALELVDEIWVLSDFVRRAIAACTDKPVHIVPLALQPPPPLANSRRALGLAEDEFVVLCSFDFNSWTTRKNPQAAIRAFQQAFPPERQDVRLILKSINGQRMPHEVRALQQLIHGDARIELRDGFLDRDGMWALQASCDVYLSLHRSEGFGLGLAECMQLGKPVVATAYSGNLEFMDEACSCLVRYALVAVREGEYPDWRDQHWADPDIDQAADYLRRLADEPAYASRIGAAARERLQQGFNVTSSFQAIAQRLTEIAATTPPLAATAISH